MSPDNTLLVLNTQTQAQGVAVAVEVSPFVAEELAGIKRVKVWTPVPSASGAAFYSWDWWPLKDTTLVLAANSDLSSSAA
jgi:hypothetical protein